MSRSDHLRQMTLAIGLRDSATFENFVAGPNGGAVAAVRGAEACVYLWGPPGCGRTHLLQAGCHGVTGEAIYLPLASHAEVVPELLEGLEAFELVCIDDLESVAGKPDWETALFHLYNRIRESGTRLRVAADAPPSALPVHLADLRSRLAWGPTFHLQMLPDDGKIEALRLRAGDRGIELPEEVARFILRRFPRDMHHLFDLLDRLDEASLAAQRKLTIPFVREQLGLGDGAAAASTPRGSSSGRP